MKRFLITLFILLLIVAIAFVGLIIWVGLNAPLKVYYDGVAVDELEKPLIASNVKPLVFELRDNAVYSAKVIPCKDAKVAFSVDGVPYDFFEIEDYSKCFSIVFAEHEGSVSLTVTPLSYFEGMLSLCYEEHEILISDDTDLSKVFTLVISNGKKECTVDFGIDPDSVRGVRIYPNEVVF